MLPFSFDKLNVRAAQTARKKKRQFICMRRSHRMRTDWYGLEFAFMGFTTKSNDFYDTPPPGKRIQRTWTVQRANSGHVQEPSSRDCMPGKKAQATANFPIEFNSSHTKNKLKRDGMEPINLTLVDAWSFALRHRVRSWSWLRKVRQPDGPGRNPER